MTDNVVSLAANRQHLSGLAHCTACKHEWVAVAPVGTVWLECPSCGTERGLMKSPVEPNDGEMEFRCNCGCRIFGIRSNETGDVWIFCVSCGTVQDPWSGIDE